MESLPPELHEGEYVRCPTSGYIYRIEKTYKKRRFASEEVYNQLGAPVFKEIDCGLLDTLPDGPEYTINDKQLITEFIYEYPKGVEEGDIVKCNETGNMYLVSNKTKRKFPNDELYKKFNYPKFKEISCDVIKSIPDGPPLTESDVPKQWYETIFGGIFSGFFKNREGFNGTQLKDETPFTKIANSFIRTVAVLVVMVLFYMINGKHVNKDLLFIVGALVFILGTIY